MPNPVSPGDVLLDHVPPMSLEAERALLGAMILDPNVIGEAIEAVESRDFYRESHRAVFEALQTIYVSQRTGRLEEAGGAEEIMTLVAEVPTASNAVHYAQTVRDKSVLRQLLNACNTIRREATQVNEDAEQILDRAQQLIFEAVARRGSSRVQAINDVISELMQKLGEWRDRKDRCLGLPTSYHELDDMTSGLQPSQLYIIAARPSVGKTSLAMCISERIAVDLNKPVLFFSLEMSAEMVTQQMLCSRARVNSHKLRRGTATEEEYKRLLMPAGKLAAAPLLIDDSSNLGILELRARARRMKAEHDIQLVVVDYLQFVHAKADSREREVAMVASGLKSLSKDLKVPVLVLAQLNRNPDGRDDKKPRLSDLRESGAIEQDADVVIMLARDVVADPNSSTKNTCDVIVAKNRTGPTGDFKLAFLAEYTRFENLVMPPAQPPV